ncbi:hypothetical protein CC2G_009994 [Coprinopsis cinerea AmutBmut pab1-1]|nr:hypothetical protein CC2G_009994 [Coprinopsis cinerea AmutBmut pab1-1]
MCERSGGAPLSVNIDVALSRIRRDKFATVLGEILAKSSQFARLSVRLYDSDLQTHLPSLTAPAPLLETLSITKMNQSAFRVSPSLPAIPHDLFGNETPRLKHLHLSGCYLPLNSQLFSGLTSLKVEFCDSALDRPHPLQDVLSALSRMPDLVHLHVTDIRIAGSCQQTVSLPHLEKLRLAFSALNVSQLLCRLQLPASVKADITFREVEPSHRHSVLEAIHTFKSRHSDPDNPIRIKSCWIRYKGNNIYFVGTTSVSHESYLCDDTDPPGSSQLQLAILQTRHRSLSATDLTSALSLGHVEKLHLLGDIDPTQERSILLAFPSTRTLNVAKVQRENLIIECLKTDPAFSTPPSVSSDCARVTYFPLLERASFACIDNPTDFVDAWALRAANGSRLKVLDLRYCRGTTTRDEGLISKLREVVDEVLVSNHHYALPWETLPAAW